MATIVNTPAATDRRADSGSGFLLGVIVLIVFLALLFFYGVPAVGRTFQGGGGTGLNVPSKIDVNVNNPGK